MESTARISKGILSKSTGDAGQAKCKSPCKPCFPIKRTCFGSNGNRFCSSGLQAIAMAAERIMAGGAEVIVAGGLESMTMIPMGGHKVSANPWLVANYPDAYLSMGLTAERIAKQFGVTREMCDEFSLHSHQKAMAAIEAGRFEEEIVPVPVSFTTPNGAKPKRQEIVFKVDEGPRADTSMEALGALKPAFHARGMVTAGNSSQM